MRTIALSQVLIAPNRQRQEFDPEALQELKNSIEENGLMHPPVLRREDGKWFLVAGERRMRAIKELYELGGKFVCDGQVFGDGPMESFIPFTDIGELNPLEAEEAELSENLHRRDLTWQELADAHARLHELRRRQAATKATHDIDLHGTVITTSPIHTIADTARELHGRADGSFQDNVRKEIIVSKHLDNPEVAKAKSLDEAFKILKRDEDRKKNVALALEVGKTFSAGKHKLFNRNCLGLMQEMVDWPAADKLDVILTDPPYGMGADEFGDGGGKLAGIEHHYDDSYEAWKKLMGGEGFRDGSVALGWCALSFLVTKPQAHAYVFCDIDRFHELKRMMQDAGWYVFRTPLTVHKINSGRVPLPDRGPRRQTEWVLYAIKGNKQVTNIYADLISAQADPNMTHGAQKPVAVYQNLLMRSVKAGDVVGDFFAGSGTILPAAHGYKCTAIACEQSPEYYAMNLQRVKDLEVLDEPGKLII